MRVRLLGPVDVVSVDRPVSGLRRKAVLAVLTLHAGQLVAADRIIDIVWGEGAAATSANTLQTHISYLRRVLGDAATIVSRPPGYVLDLRDGATDVQVAEHLVRLAAHSAEPAIRAAHLRDAVDLFQGPPLADVAGIPWFDAEAARLSQLRLEAQRALADARLQLGEHVEVAPELERLAGEHPYDERLHELLMLALYRSGRQSDALAVYQRLRTRLADELGIDPGQALRDLETAVLRQDAALRPAPAPLATAAPTEPAPAGVPVPAQLPMAVPAFAGRHAELSSLDGLLADALPADGGAPRGVLVAAVSGTAGVGKTALVVHWAHRVADRFPDGQLYVNLRGFDPDGAVRDPSEVLRGFLDALGEPADRVPSTLDAQAAQYRSALAGKRVLVVLDNARDAEQVRPLLPGTPGCVAVVTSRDRLTSLVATDGASPLSVGLMRRAEAHDLLARRVGADRLAAEPAAVEEIVARCAALPLALAITAARAATEPGRSLAALAASLHEAGALDALDGGDARSDARAVFYSSYRALRPEAALLFRRLGAHPGPDFDLAGAASAAGQPPDAVRRTLADLVRANLLGEHTAGRYALHDLLRVFAAEQMSADERRAAVDGILDHYLYAAYTGATLLSPSRDPIGAVPAVTPYPPEMGDHDEALAWFRAESGVLLAAVELAARHGAHAHAWRLAWALMPYLRRRALWPEHVAAQRTAVASARRLGDIRAQAWAHYALGNAVIELGRHDDARRHYHLAVGFYRGIGDRRGEAHTLLSLASPQARQEPRAALAHCERALALFRSVGHKVGEARALSAVGWCHSELGDHRQALEYCQLALSMFQEFDDRMSEAITWDSLGHAHRHLGDHRQAVTCFRSALDLFRDLDDPAGAAEELVALGDVLAECGDSEGARRDWTEAARIYDELGDPEAGAVRERLRQPLALPLEPANH